MKACEVKTTSNEMNKRGRTIRELTTRRFGFSEKFTTLSKVIANTLNIVSTRGIIRTDALAITLLNIRSSLTKQV